MNPSRCIVAGCDGGWQIIVIISTVLCHPPSQPVYFRPLVLPKDRGASEPRAGASPTPFRFQLPSKIYYSISWFRSYKIFPTATSTSHCSILPSCIFSHLPVVFRCHLPVVTTHRLRVSCLASQKRTSVLMDATTQATFRRGLACNYSRIKGIALFASWSGGTTLVCGLFEI